MFTCHVNRLPKSIRAALSPSFAPPSMSRFVINSVPFQTRVSHGAKHILARDQARARKLLAGLHAHGPAAFQARTLYGQDKEGDDTLGQVSLDAQRVPPVGDPAASLNSIDVTDAAVTYTMPVGIGQPPTTYTLLIDTGSSNTWVGAGKKYTPTSTSVDTNKAVIVTYGSGSFSGTEHTDQVTFGGNLVIENQPIGVASHTVGFEDVDGILGIGPVDLTTGTVKGIPSIPTVTDNLVNQGLMPTESIAISFFPTTSASNVANGEITFGATDTAKFKGSMNYVPITQTSPANRYWGIDQTLTYGTSTPLLKSSAGIVDTGTALLLIASDAFRAYQQATGALMDRKTGLLTITETQFENLQSLFFEIGSETYEFTRDAQIWSRSLNATIGGEQGQIYLVVADMGSESGAGLDFINGFVFLQRFYSVYDTTNNRVGLATTQSTKATTN